MTDISVVETEADGIATVVVGFPGPQGPAQDASIVTFTPAGNIAATNVQDAIEELDSEKLAKASNLSDVASALGSRINLGVARSYDLEHFCTPGDSSASVKTANAAAIVAAFATHPDLIVNERFYFDPFIIPSTARSLIGRNRDSCILEGAPGNGTYLIDKTDGGPIYLEDLAVVVPVDGTGTQRALRIFNSAGDAIVNRLRLAGSIGLRMDSAATARMRVEDTLVEDWYEGGLVFLGGESTRVLNCDVLPVTVVVGNGGHAIAGINTPDIKVLGGFIDSPGVFGVSVTALSANVVGVEIADIRIKGSKFEAIGIDAATGFTLSQFIIANAHLTYEENAVSQDFGLHVFPDGGTIKDGLIEGCVVSGAGKNAIILLEGSSGVEVNNNRIINPGTWASATSAEKTGISFATVSNNSAVGNHITDALGNMLFNIGETGASDNNQYADNTGAPGTSGYYSINGANSTVSRINGPYANNTSTDPIHIIEQDGTGDATLEWLLTGGQGWFVGIDNSDSDKLKIGHASGFSTYDVGFNPSTGNLDTPNRIIIGHSAPINADFGQSGHIQVHSGGAGAPGIGSFFGWTTTTSQGPTFVFAKSKSNTIGTHAVVVNTDVLGTIFFEGSDGTDFETAASIQAEVDGTPGDGDMPGRLKFSTTADGAVSPTERMRIDAAGNIICNTAAVATDATNGFLYVPTCAGTPTGTPTAYTGRVPIVVDTTNNKLYFYSGGAWRDAGP